jgi:ribosomal protein S18 acetylase RimI-like enzyme
VEIVHLSAGDADRVVAAGHLFDDEPKPDATARFLAEPGHHLLVAYQDGVPAGFITGVETVHPDKGTEMFLYEMGVAEAYRGRGIGRELVRHLVDLARSKGCYGMWVGTEATNAAALVTYRAAGASRDEEQATILTWRFDAD